MSNVIVEDVFRTEEFERTLNKAVDRPQDTEGSCSINGALLVIFTFLALGLLAVALLPHLEKMVEEYNERYRLNQQR